MSSKYFKPSGSFAKFVPPGSKKLIADPNVQEKYIEAQKELTMALIRSGRNLLMSFNSQTVSAIPEKILPPNSEITRLNDRAVYKRPIKPQLKNNTKLGYNEKANKIISDIRRKVYVRNSNKASILKNYGVSVGSTGSIFYPFIIYYSSTDINGYMDLFIKDVEDQITSVAYAFKLESLK
jgi:hypothetical protein